MTQGHSPSTLACQQGYVARQEKAMHLAAEQLGMLFVVWL